MPRSTSLKSKKPFSKTAKEFYVICQNIRSLFNVGAIFRTSDAFAVNKIFLTGITGRPPRKEISKVALGAEQFIPWEYHRQPTRLIKQLKKQGVRIVALEQVKGKSIDLNQWKPKFPLVLMLGYEPKGLPKSLLKLADDVVEIPMYGQKESLNVGVAFGIAGNHIAQYVSKRK
ncbi:MAG: tRNA/rRNA methyltransferase SpoU [Candidatus Doudnabacteria bacterium]|nr:tRNA/rRNA methyltransferase SpoU [Candidatus Doudnabacteria bacterium]